MWENVKKFFLDASRTKVNVLMLKWIPVTELVSWLSVRKQITISSHMNR